MGAVVAFLTSYSYASVETQLENLGLSGRFSGTQRADLWRFGAGQAICGLGIFATDRLGGDMGADGMYSG